MVIQMTWRVYGTERKFNMTTLPDINILGDILQKQITEKLETLFNEQRFLDLNKHLLIHLPVEPLPSIVISAYKTHLTSNELSGTIWLDYLQYPSDAEKENNVVENIRGQVQLATGVIAKREFHYYDGSVTYKFDASPIVIKIFGGKIQGAIGVQIQNAVNTVEYYNVWSNTTLGDFYNPIGSNTIRVIGGRGSGTNGEFNVSRGIIKYTDMKFNNITVGNLINLSLTTIQACDSTTNRTIQANASGVYGCNNTGSWVKIF